MRFSLKWILAGVASVAVVAAAFGNSPAAYAEILWAASLLSIAYAAAVALFGKSRLRVCMATFVFASVLFLLSLAFGGDIATARMLVRLGMGRGSGQAGWVLYRSSPSGQSVEVPSFPGVDFGAYIHAADAVATLAFGVMGSLVGLLAFRAAGRDAIKHEDPDKDRKPRYCA